MPECVKLVIRKTLALVSMVSLLSFGLSVAQDANYTFKAQTELVLVNVTVRDKNGNLIKDLKRDDFTVLEDNKPQSLASFDIENTESIPVVPQQQVNLLGAANTTLARRKPLQPDATPAARAIKDRRLMILFFDLSEMQPDEVDRSVEAAQKFLQKQMQPADMVSIVSLASSITVNQDFTSDRDQLNKALESLNNGGATGYDQGSTGTTEGTSENGNSFTVDDTEYNIFNTDRRLEALRAVAEQVASVPQKKSLIYFSSGMQRTGIENQSELRAATNAAVLANMSIYTVDIRGLQAIVPGGEAQNASLRGTSPYSGGAQLAAYDTNFQTQETLVTLASDTGGRAYLDTNDFGRVFRSVQDDTSTYYLLGYHSTNTARDGKFRRITVRLNRPGYKLEYRKGYYAEADFRHSDRQNRERQLQEELASDLPSTDLPVYLSTGYFRLTDTRYYVPVSLLVPGSEIPFSRNGEQDKATLDVLGLVTDEKKVPASEIRDTVRLAVNTSSEVQRKNVQYTSGITLPPGKYHLKVVVRENQSGRMGSFETDFVIPDLKSTPLKMSSIVMANQVQPAKSHDSNDPLIRNGAEIVPSVTRVFASGQHLYLYYEVYDPAHNNHNGNNSAAGKPDKTEKSAKAAGPPVRVLSSVAFFKGDAKAYETSLVEVQQLSVPNRKAAVFQLDVPLTELKPGFYNCQVNVIDDAAGHFAFPRVAMLVRQ